MYSRAPSSGGPVGHMGRSQAEADLANAGLLAVFGQEIAIVKAHQLRRARS
ncbi:hypothetical protein [Roseateles cavernae]|uniref:hypothetical protein n=1 Tax=Roseateles cavernae TaxID=3153578 RepID=UPI0032E478A0